MSFGFDCQCKQTLGTEGPGGTHRTAGRGRPRGIRGASRRTDPRGGSGGTRDATAKQTPSRGNGAFHLSGISVPIFSHQGQTTRAAPNKVADSTLGWIRPDWQLHAATKQTPSGRRWGGLSFWGPFKPTLPCQGKKNGRRTKLRTGCQAVPSY